MDSILIIGKPNSGKSLLFNKITGVFQKVSNFPGVTVEVKKAKAGNRIFADYPGIYSLNPLTKDEEVAVSKFKEAINEADTKSILCVLDATRLERSLNLGLQIKQYAIQHNKPVVFALNMIDEVQKKKLKLDIDKLKSELHSEVFAVSARTGFGIDTLKSYLNGEDASLYQASDEEKKIIAEHPGRLAKKICEALNLNTEIFIQSQNKIDRFLLNNVLGGIVFMAIMLIVFESIFTWAGPAMDLTEEIIVGSGEWVSSFIGDGILKDFINDAIFGGLGSFIVFVPQIFVLTFIIGVLEDSGYLARAAIICHKPFSYFGLTGKSFVPFLTGHACAIPAIFATRTIESPKRRLLTMLAVPLTACSARLPVYALLITAVIPAKDILGGLIGLQGLSFFLLYFFGIFMGLVLAGILSKTVYKTESDAPFVIELPSYRLPQWMPLIRKSLNSSYAFVKNAGFVIFSVSVVIWFLGYFPNQGGDLASSYLGSLGHFIEPIFAPLGIDWKFGVAIITSFLAREVFVGTLGTMMGIEGADENVAGLADHLISSGITLATGVSLLVFYAIAMQCVATLGVIKKETGKLSYAVSVFIVYGILAYLLSLAVYSLLS
ncbi:MAG: ferrous iron transporter B [Bdellovibrionaceae bacterium]|nr:ferrous iron transporter B [Pseudobdellovibrionaceae bacterium]|tara:strand:- start:39419 stop:41233 length:1815 start_codon:yes stop_codon:yes gene_type:complete